MKKLLLFAVLLIGLTSCTEEQIDCNCEVVGYQQILSVRYENGIPVTRSSEPLWIEPYDTIVNCDQNQVEWYDINTIQYPADDSGNINFDKITNYKRINCN